MTSTMKVFTADNPAIAAENSTAFHAAPSISKEKLVGNASKKPSRNVHTALSRILIQSICLLILSQSPFFINIVLLLQLVMRLLVYIFIELLFCYRYRMICTQLLQSVQTGR